MKSKLDNNLKKTGKKAKDKKINPPSESVRQSADSNEIFKKAVLKANKKQIDPTVRQQELPKATLKSLANNEESYKKQILIQTLKHNEDKHNAQLKYLEKIFVASVLYVVIVLVILWKQMCMRNGLSDSVLIALLTTTTTTVIGVFLVATKWLFPLQKIIQERK